MRGRRIWHASPWLAMRAPRLCARRSRRRADSSSGRGTGQGLHAAPYAARGQPHSNTTREPTPRSAARAARGRRQPRPGVASAGGAGGRGRPGTLRRGRWASAAPERTRRAAGGAWRPRRGGRRGRGGHRPRDRADAGAPPPTQRTAGQPGQCAQHKAGDRTAEQRRAERPVPVEAPRDRLRTLPYGGDRRPPRRAPRRPQAGHDGDATAEQETDPRRAGLEQQARHQAPAPAGASSPSCTRSSRAVASLRRRTRCT